MTPKPRVRRPVALISRPGGLKVLAQRFCEELGAHSVPKPFYEEEIPRGERVDLETDWAFEHADVILVLLGEGWETASPDITKAQPWGEMTAALANPNSPEWIVVLMDTAALVAADHVPADMQFLVKKKPFRVRSSHLESDTGEVAERIREELNARKIPCKENTQSKRASAVHLYSGFPAEVFKRQIAEASTIRIIHTWTTYIGTNHEAMVRALAGGCEISVLLSHPDSQASLMRGNDSEEDVTRRVNQTLVEIRKVYKAARQITSTPPKLEVRTYTQLPYFALYACESSAIVGYYSYGGRSHDMPHVVAPGRTNELLTAMHRQFEQLWSRAYRYDLLSEKPSSSVDVLRRKIQGVFRQFMFNSPDG